MFRSTLIVAIFVLAKAADDSQWSYSDSNVGPSDWPGDCKKDSQSPIDIENPEYDSKLTEIKLTNFDHDNGHVVLQNIGHSVVVTLNQGMTMTLPGVAGSWEAVQFHFHWGTDSSKGSEHTVAGKAYPKEMHIVHMNAECYPNVTSCLSRPDGLAVLGFFIEVGSANPAWDSFLERFPNISSNGNSTTLKNFTMSNLMLPTSKMTSYYRYQGSLTTPPCSEVVTWTLFSNSIELSEAQLDKFRAVNLGENLINNFRPPQPIGKRTVYTSNKDLTDRASQATSSATSVAFTVLLAKIYL